MGTRGDARPRPPSPTAELSSGPIHYLDSGGTGPTVVFVHGILMDGEVWEPTVELLGAAVRCVRPALPLGAHTTPMRPSADMSPLGVARLIAEFLEALDLEDVTVVATDTGGAITQLLLADGCDRIGRVVLTPCDSFENFLPPSIRALQYAARIPGLVGFGANVLRWARVRRLALHWLSRSPLDPAMLERWARPLIDDRRIARDLERFLAAIDHRDTLAAAETLRTYPKPVLLTWPHRLPYFPLAHAQRWARLLPHARVVEVPDSWTLVCQDQPGLLAEHITRFVAGPADDSMITGATDPGAAPTRSSRRP